MIDCNGTIADDKFLGYIQKNMKQYFFLFSLNIGDNKSVVSSCLCYHTVVSSLICHTNRPVRMPAFSYLLSDVRRVATIVAPKDILLRFAATSSRARRWAFPH